MSGLRDKEVRKITIDVDGRLLKRALEITGLRNNSEIVNAALALLVRMENRKGILSYFGSGIWQGDIRRSRCNRTFPRSR